MELPTALTDFVNGLLRRTHIGTVECLGHAAIKGIPSRSIIGLICLSRDGVGSRLSATFAANPRVTGGQYGLLLHLYH